MAIFDNEIRSRIDTFATELVAVVRRAALEAVTAALGGADATAPPPPAKRGRGRPRKAAALVPAPAAKATPAAKRSGAKKAAASKRGPGEKRPPAELAKLVARLGDYIKAHPGQRMEVIGKALGGSSRDLMLPVRKLLKAKRIRVQGERRATEYFPT